VIGALRAAAGYRRRYARVRGQVFSQAFFYPTNAPVVRRTSDELGLVASARRVDGGSEVALASTRLVRSLQ
jgi:hypothetical protein